MNKALIFVFIFLFLCIFAFGQDNNQAALEQLKESIFRQGLDDFYSQDFSSSRDKFNQLIVLEPENPKWQWRGILAVLVGFDDGAKGFNADKAVLTKVQFELPNSLCLNSLALAERKLRARPNDRQLHLYRAGFLLARSAAVIEYARQKPIFYRFDDYAQASDATKEAVKELKPLASGEEPLAEAQLLLGQVNYQLGLQSFFIKKLFLDGLPHDKKTGIELIRRSVASNSIFRDDARLALFYIFLKDGRQEEASVIGEDLLRRYPRIPPNSQIRTFRSRH